MIYFLMHIVNDVPLSKSDPIESETPPEIIAPYTDVWTEAQWLDYLAAQNTEPDPPTFDQLMGTEQIDNYKLFREQLADALELAGGWDNCTGEQQVFCAKNLLGTAAQRASVLTDEPKQHLEFLLEKGVI
jgi:hypothetical protein